MSPSAPSAEQGGLPETPTRGAVSSRLKFGLHLLPPETVQMGAWHTGGARGTGQGQATPWLSALSYFGVLRPESTFWVQVASWPSVTKTGPRVLWGQRAALATCPPLPDPALGQLPPRQTSTAGQALPADPPPARRVLLRPQRGVRSPALGPTDHLLVTLTISLSASLSRWPLFWRLQEVIPVPPPPRLTEVWAPGT